MATLRVSSLLISMMSWTITRTSQMNPLQRSPKYMLLFYYLLLVSIATLLLNVLNLVLFVSTLSLMLKLFFKTSGASNPSWHPRTDSTDHNYPKSFTKLVAGTARIFTLGKRSEDFTTGKWNISRPFWNMITLLQLLITSKQLVTTSNGTILASGKTDYHCKVKKTLFIQELRPTLNASVSSEKLLLH